MRQLLRFIVFMKTSFPISPNYHNMRYLRMPLKILSHKAWTNIAPNFMTYNKL